MYLSIQVATRRPTRERSSFDRYHIHMILMNVIIYNENDFNLERLTIYQKQIVKFIASVETLEKCRSSYVTNPSFFSGFSTPNSSDNPDNPDISRRPYFKTTSDVKLGQ